MQDHELRVVNEFNELDTKISRLSTFNESSPIFNSLPGTERELLIAQLHAMCAYRGILKMRIALFSVRDALR